MEPQTLGLLIPIVSIVFGIGLAGVVIYLGYRRKKELFVLYHQERMAALEKGVELPPLPDALLSDDGKPLRPYHPRRHLLKGLTWLFIGLGLGVALGPTAGWDISLFALIPLGIGLAHLIYYFVEGKREMAEMEVASSLHPRE
jgi:hypothetical protein